MSTIVLMVLERKINIKSACKTITKMVKGIEKNDNGILEEKHG